MDQPVTTRNVLLFATQGPDSTGAAADLLQRCRAHPVAERWWLTIAGDAQLQIEHALELNRNDLAVFVVDGEGPGPTVEFHAVGDHAAQPMRPANAPATPEEVLHVLATLGRRTELPECYVLTVRGGDSESAPELDKAHELLLSLLENPLPEHWASQLLNT